MWVFEEFTYKIDLLNFVLKITTNQFSEWSDGI